MQRIDFVRVLRKYDWEPVKNSKGGRRGKGAHETFQNKDGKRQGFSIHTGREIGVPLLKDLCKRFDIPFEEAFENMAVNPPGFKELSLYNEPRGTLGKLIYESRRLQDLARGTLARLLNTDVVTVAAWEKNEKIPSDAHLVQLIERFQWSEDDMRVIKSVGQQLIALWTAAGGSKETEATMEIVVAEPPNKMKPIDNTPRPKSADIDISQIRYRDVERWLRDRMQSYQTLVRRVADFDSREESLRSEASALRINKQNMDTEIAKLQVQTKDLQRTNTGLTSEIERLNRQVAEMRQTINEAQDQATTPKQVVALTDEEKSQIAEWRRKAIMYDNLQRAGLA